MDRSSIGTRMKSYEDAQKTYLTRRMPVMIRVDGNAFHTFTRGFERPFDSIMEDYFIPENELPENHRNNLSPRTLDPEEDEYGVWRSRWVIDKEIPIFTQNKNYVNDLFLNKH